MPLTPLEGQPTLLELLCIRADLSGVPLPQEETKLVVVVRGDLQVSVGKIAAQVGHVATDAMNTCFDCKPSVLLKWMMDGQKKVVVKAPNMSVINDIISKAESSGMCTSVIHDAGRTEVEPDTVIAVGIGPDAESKFVGITDKLRLF